MRPLGPTRPRPAVLAGLLLAATLLAGCADDGTTAEDTAPSLSTSTVPAPASSPDPGGDPSADPGDQEVESDEVAILSATAAGGTVSEAAVALKDDTAVQEFAGQFSDAELGDEISSTVAQTDVPVGMALYGAVIAVGCDVPPGVVVGNSDQGVTITAQKVASPQLECFAPVTSVGLVLVTD